MTQIWTAFLATLATLAIGILWVFSQGNGDAVLQSEGNALRAVANASLAALESEIDRSDVVVAQDFVRTPKLNAIARRATRSASPGRFARAFRDLAYQGPLQRYPELNLALVDPWGDLLAEAGLASDELRTIAKQTRRSEGTKELRQPDPVLTIITGRPFVLSIHTIDASELRLISLAPLKVNAEGPIRRSLGSSYAGALLRGPEIALEFSGSGTVQNLLNELPARMKTPSSGISDYFVAGQGADRRLAVSGRLAAKYRFGAKELSLLVISPNNAGYQLEGTWSRLSGAWTELGQRGRGMLALAMFWIASVGISIILPRIEWVLPVQRLTGALSEPLVQNDRLVQGPWNRHFEALVAAIGQRTLRSSTHRTWRVSSKAASLVAANGSPAALECTRDATPTDPCDAVEAPDRLSA